MADLSPRRVHAHGFLRSKRPFVEFDRSVHVAVVGETDGRHAKLLRRRNHIFEFLQAIEKAIVGMSVQVNI